VQTNVPEIDAFITLEVYGVTSCADYPNGSDTFSGLYITANGRPVTPSWSAVTGNNTLSCADQLHSS
jgi:hypothetical protein